MEKDTITFNNSNKGISNIHVKCTEKEPKNYTFTHILSHLALICQKYNFSIFFIETLGICHD